MTNAWRYEPVFPLHSTLRNSISSWGMSGKHCCLRFCTYYSGGFMCRLGWQCRPEESIPELLPAGQEAWSRSRSWTRDGRYSPPDGPAVHAALQGRWSGGAKWASHLHRCRRHLRNLQINRGSHPYLQGAMGAIIKAYRLRLMAQSIPAAIMVQCNHPGPAQVDL